MKKIKILLASLVMVMALIIGLFACQKETESQRESDPISKEVEAVVSKFFTTAGQMLVTGAPADFSLCTPEGRPFCEDLLQRAYHKREFLFEGIEGSIKNLQIDVSGDTIKTVFSYVSKQYMSPGFLTKYPGESNTVINIEIYDMYFISVEGKLKISYAHLYTESDYSRSHHLTEAEDLELLEDSVDHEAIEERSTYTYVRANAVNNAISHTVDGTLYGNNNYDPYYKNLNPADCSNFTSQCLSAGYIPYKDPYNNINSSGSWWYNTNGTPNVSNDTHTLTWSTANSLYNYLIGTGRGTLSNLQSMQVGDIVFAKWVDSSYGSCYSASYNHAMLVTAVVKTSNIVTDVKLTYHSVNRVNRLLVADIIPNNRFQCNGTLKSPIITYVKVNNTGTY